MVRTIEHIGRLGVEEGSVVFICVDIGHGFVKCDE
jgi:hypothetical protein